MIISFNVHLIMYLIHAFDAPGLVCSCSVCGAVQLFDSCHVAVEMMRWSSWTNAQKRKVKKVRTRDWATQWMRHVNLKFKLSIC